MQARQSTILAEAWSNRVEDLPLATPQEVLIMASIIEKETAVPDERRAVASVFENRLKRGMRLQTDPTVIYGVTNGQGVLDRGLRQSELRGETPYNTYVIDGLPPTPIANPGRASIEAAVNPRPPTTSTSWLMAPVATPSRRPWMSITATSRAGARSRRNGPTSRFGALR